MNETEIANILRSVLNVLEELEVRGKRNHTIIVACMNDLERILQARSKEVESIGHIHAEQ